MGLSSLSSSSGSRQGARTRTAARSHALCSSGVVQALRCDWITASVSSLENGIPQTLQTQNCRSSNIRHVCTWTKPPQAQPRGSSVPPRPPQRQTGHNRAGMPPDAAELMINGVWYAAKLNKKKVPGGVYPLGYHLLAHAARGVRKPEARKPPPDLPPAVQAAVDGWVHAGDPAWMVTSRAPDLAKPPSQVLDALVSKGYNVMAHIFPLISKREGYACPPVSTSEHDQRMLYFARADYPGGHEPDQCAMGQQCAGLELAGAPNPLPVYYSMPEEAHALRGPKEAAEVARETQGSICLQCIRAEAAAIKLMFDVVSNSREETGRHFALVAPFTNLVDVPGGYFQKYMAVTPVTSPQISNCAIVGATPKDEATGEPALRVAYDNAPGPDGRPKGLFICQQAMMYVPQPQRP